MRNIVLNGKLNEVIKELDELKKKEEKIVTKKENDKLKMQIIDSNDKREIVEITLKKLRNIVRTAIDVNLRKTNKAITPDVIKSYRENLLVLREISDEIDTCFDRLKKES